MDAVVMILRVWALYSRSRIILGALLTFYFLEVIPYLIVCIISSTQEKTLGM